MKSSEVVRTLRARAEAYSDAFHSAREFESAYQALKNRGDGRALDLLVNWTRSHLQRIGARGLLVGVSGGVDSSLCAWVMKKAAGDSCLGVILPAHSDDADEKDAVQLLEALEIPRKRFDLSPVVDATLEALKGDEGEKEATRDAMAVGNLGARLRTAVLYHLAAQMNYLVMGTSDLDETWIGYGCKGSASDISPLVGLHKEEVRMLVRLAYAPIDEALAHRLSQRPASPGYFPGQLAEEELGLSYARIGKGLDVILDSCEITPEGGVVPRRSARIRKALDSGEVKGQDLIRVAELITVNLHKTLSSPALWPDPPELPQND
jgi:NAD+ synthase